jgi:hypothetical protein
MMKGMVYATFFILHSSFFISCSDRWDEHYSEADVETSTLWQMISSVSELSNFASVAEACGYDRILDGSQTYTVFAPTNLALSEAEAQQLIADYRRQEAEGVRSNENTVVRRFLQNHIALYRHPVSSLTDKTIKMMNDKYAALTPEGLLLSKMSIKNVLCDNGLLFTINGKLDYVPNVLECLDMTEGLDSVYQFINSHSTYEFDETQSVPGEIIDGLTHYLDSVTVFSNDLLTKYGLINSEDSTYWMVAPVNSEWNRLVDEYQPYFNYPNNTAGRDSMVYTNTRVAIVCGSIFSRTNNPEVAFADSAVSTQASTAAMRKQLGIDESYYVYPRPFDQDGIFYQTEDIPCSNGHVRKTDVQRISKFQTFMQTIKVEAENSQYQDTLINAVEPVTIVQVVSNNPFYNQVSGNAFIEVVPSSPSARVVVGFKMPNLLSSVKYDIYAVFAPATAADTLAVTETMKEVRVLSRVRQPDQNGVMTSPPFRYAKSIDPTTVNEVKLQSGVKLTTCSYGLSEPQVRLELQSNTDGATLRIDRLIFKPIEDL